MEKMDKTVTMLLMLVILGIFISSSEAETTCVQCASLLSPSCGDPYSESSSHSTCSADFCVKSKYQYRGDVRFVICLLLRLYFTTTAAAAIM